MTANPRSQWLSGLPRVLAQLTVGCLCSSQCLQNGVSYKYLHHSAIKLGQSLPREQTSVTSTAFHIHEELNTA